MLEGQARDQAEEQLDNQDVKLKVLGSKRNSDNKKNKFKARTTEGHMLSKKWELGVSPPESHIHTTVNSMLRLGWSSGIQ